MPRRGTILIAVIVVAAATVAGCSGSHSTQFQVDLHRADGVTAFPVVLSDETGLVTGIESAPPDPQAGDQEPVARPDPDDPNAFIASWLGGACDKGASLTFKLVEGVYELHLAVDSSFLGSCMAMAIPRDIRIATSSPIPIDSIVVAGWH